MNVNGHCIKVSAQRHGGAVYLWSHYSTKETEMEIKRETETDK